MSIKIYPLSTCVANQIAAGEVIERPASVIKELLENALDAKANHVTISLRCGGLNSMSVSDNGEGIFEADLPFAVMPHATSKIRLLSDLSYITTMGFRGEALASIASVSKLVIQSKPQTQNHAMQISVSGENIQIQPCARNTGTTILVEDLFFNAPVRKRFLKSERTEFLMIDKLVRCFALSAPQLSLDFYHNDQAIFSLPKGINDKAILERIRKLLGKTFVDAAIYIETSLSEIKIRGWITQTEYARSQQDRMWTYVNGRMVNDKLLNHAIKQAYGDKLHPGRYPACLLYLEMNTEEVDINVHPTKHELRFHQPRMVHDAVRSAIEESLNSGIIKQETIQKKPAYAIKSMPVNNTWSNASETSRLVALNQDFVLLIKDPERYILNVRKISQAELLARLRTQTLPLRARPLLVPIHIPLKEGAEVGLEQHFELFAQIGLNITWAGEKSLLVRSIPVDVPQLEIQHFLHVCLNKTSLKIEELLNLLVIHQSVNGMMLNENDKNNLLGFLDACKEHEQSNYMQLLTIEHCQSFFK